MLMSQASALDQLCVNTIRTLAIDAVQRANSGHPGLPLGAAPMAYVLWQRHLKHDPDAPDWADRDRFVLSAGHGSMLVYALLHLYGYDLSLEDVQNFRQWGSKTPGHPEFGVTPGVEATTGPLGQGTANAVGMAMAERFLAGRFNTREHSVTDHFTYALVSDGDLMEGLSAEAASLAGHLRLGKLVYLYDSNDISLDGPCSLHFSEDVGKRYEACGWHVQTVADGDTDLDGIDRAIQNAKAETERPSLVIVKTTIGFGSPNKAGKAASHGSPLGEDEVRKTKEALGASPESFVILPEAREHFENSLERGRTAREGWNQVLAAWKKAQPELARDWDGAWSGRPPAGWDKELPSFEKGEKVATRVAGGKVQNAIARKLPWLWGGDADLSCSTMTALADEAPFEGQEGRGRNVHYGVREHAMGSIANGIAYHGGSRSFTATFFVFSDYMRPAMRLAAMNHLPVVYVFTHDSIGLGEDGPTHQPVEHLMSLRAMPGLVVLRPADANETSQAWCVAMEQTKRPVALVFSRQKLATLEEARTSDGVRRGAYVLRDPEGSAPQAVLIATGAEVHNALAVQEKLATEKVFVRVVSMPSWELFEEQDATYRESVLSPSLPRLSIEAGATLGWSRWIGEGGKAIGIDHFGASAPADVLFEQFGFGLDAVAQEVRALLG